MKREVLLGLVRHVLTAAGGYLVAQGLADDSSINELAGGIVTVLGVSWSIWVKWQGKKAAAGVVAMVLLAGLVAGGCVRLAPGEDALVVRVEQTQEIAAPTFDLVLSVDDASRDYWRTNAPGFHGFCEWLRQPIAYASPEFGETNVARVLMMQFQVDDLKQDYRRARASSNDLHVAWQTLQSALSQAEAWKGVIFTQRR